MEWGILPCNLLLDRTADLPQNSELLKSSFEIGTHKYKQVVLTGPQVKTMNKLEIPTTWNLG